MFTIQLITSFVVGGLFIAMQTLIAERVAPRWRGMMLTVPSTMALGFFFIAVTKTTADVTEAARIIPAALVASYVFVVVFSALSRYRLWMNFLASYGAWGLCAYIILAHPPESFITSMLLYAMLPIALLYILIRQLPQITVLTPVPMTPKHIVVRALIGGSVIVLVVILAKTLGNMWGGMFSAFPAAFSATFLIYASVHGKQIIPSVGKSLFFPGAIGFVLYAWSVGVAYPRIGIWFGTLMAYIVVLAFYIVHAIVRDRFIRR